MIEYENLGKVNAPFVEDFKCSFQSVLRKGWYILGESVLDFEKSFSGYIGVNHAIGVASGLDALLLALKSLDLKCFFQN